MLAVASKTQRACSDFITKNKTKKTHLKVETYLALCLQPPVKKKKSVHTNIYALNVNKKRKSNVAKK